MESSKDTIGIQVRREKPPTSSQQQELTATATRNIKSRGMTVLRSHVEKNTMNPGNQKRTIDVLYLVADGFLDHQRDILALYQTSRSMAIALVLPLYKKDILGVKDRDTESGVQHYDDKVYQMAKCNYESHNSALARKHREFPRHFGKKPPALHWASTIGSVSMANKIIKVALKEYCHYLNSKDMYGCTPLFLAVEHGCVEIVRALVEAGCYVDAPVRTVVCINKYLNLDHFESLAFNQVIARPYWKGNTGNLHEATPLAYAITHRKLAIAELLTTHTRRPYITCDEQGLVSVLDLASIAGMTEVVRVLLLRQMTPSSSQAERHYLCACPLHFAALRGNNREVMELLIKYGPLHTAEDINEESPLTWAIRSCNVSNTLYLIQLEKKDYVGKRFKTAILASTGKEFNHTITQALVERFISQDRIYDIESTLATLLQRGEKARLGTQYLLHLLAVRIQKRHWKRSRTYLHWALNREVVAEEVIETFIDQCLWLIDINAKDSDDKTALYYAKKLKHKKIAKLLKKHGAKKK